jgi:prepilin-type N-terminal cleavage/methylation domain-containing protein
MSARSGFTLFELLAVITIIGVVLAVTLGSYQGWGDAQAVRGSAEVVEAALNRARDRALSSRQPVSFEYATAVDFTNGVRKVAQYRLIQERSVSAATNSVPQDLRPDQQLGPTERLPGSVWIVRRWPAEQMAQDASDRFVFLPNGRAVNPKPDGLLQLFVVSRKKRGDGLPNALYHVRIDPSTGAIHSEKLNPDQLSNAL